MKPKTFSRAQVERVVAELDKAADAAFFRAWDRTKDKLSLANKSRQICQRAVARHVLRNGYKPNAKP